MIYISSYSRCIHVFRDILTSFHIFILVVAPFDNIIDNIILLIFSGRHFYTSEFIPVDLSIESAS